MNLNELTASTLLSTNPSDNIMLKIKLAYQSDEQCKQILLDHANNENTSSWKVDANGMIKRNSQYFVPSDQIIRTSIISCNHDDPTASHRGIAKTIDLISRNFYWKHMHNDIKQYVHTCISCQQNKNSTHAPLGLLHPITTPESRWHTWTIDFITSLPKTKSGKDCIIVVSDKLSKLSHFISTVTEITAPGTAQLLFDNVVKLHGLPIRIISDRDPRFTSSFWKQLWNQLGTKLKMSTAYHPQSDGQTERTNKTLEEQLRAYVNYHQNNWDEHLSMCEFAFNNAINSTTGYSPFFLNYGQHPTTPLLYEVRKLELTNEATETMLEQLYDTLEHAQMNITKSQLAQKKYADKHRSDFEQFNIGDKVLLSTDNLRVPGRAPKLCPKRIGPFTITKVLSKLNYEIELPSTLKQTHNIFHVSQLTKFHSTDLFPTRPNLITRPPATVLPNQKQELYEVQQILKHKGHGNRLKYLVHWKGYPEYEATWEPVSSFHQHRDVIHTYEQLLRNKLSSSIQHQNSSIISNTIQICSQKYNTLPNTY